LLCSSLCGGRNGAPGEGRLLLEQKGVAIMNRSALRQILREMVENNTGEPLEHFDDDSDLRTGLGLDSVDIITLAMEIQDRFKVAIAANDFEQIHNVGSLLDLIHSRLPPASQAA
jgi:acyl carrier protein